MIEEHKYNKAAPIDAVVLFKYTDTPMCQYNDPNFNAVSDYNCTKIEITHCI